MSKKSHYSGKKTRVHLAGGARTAVVREVPVYERKEPVEYGNPFIVMEDAEKNTFAYNGSAWVGYRMTMAECRLECQVKELPQKVNGKVRYEVREPIVKK
ncbi:MAG: hypothetical protein ACO1RT_17990 [Planctomycetaceae bacterium]